MSYIVILLYSFACDHPGCSGLYECAPANLGSPRLLDAAHAELRKEGWSVAGHGGDRKHYCPHHKPTATKV